MNQHKKGLLTISVVMLVILQGFSQNITLPPGGGNQKASVSQWMGLVKANFKYNSPDVTTPTSEDRTGKISGGLVPLGKLNLGLGSSEASPSPAAANENTQFSVSHDV